MPPTLFGNYTPDEHKFLVQEAIDHAKDEWTQQQKATEALERDQVDEVAKLARYIISRFERNGYLDEIVKLQLSEQVADEISRRKVSDIVNTLKKEYRCQIEDQVNEPGFVATVRDEQHTRMIQDGTYDQIAEELKDEKTREIIEQLKQEKKRQIEDTVLGDEFINNTTDWAERAASIELDEYRKQLSDKSRQEILHLVIEQGRNNIEQSMAVDEINIYETHLRHFEGPGVDLSKLPPETNLKLHFGAAIKPTSSYQRTRIIKLKSQGDGWYSVESDSCWGYDAWRGGSELEENKLIRPYTVSVVSKELSETSLVSRKSVVKYELADGKRIDINRRLNKISINDLTVPLPKKI